MSTLNEHTLGVVGIIHKHLNKGIKIKAIRALRSRLLRMPKYKAELEALELKYIRTLTISPAFNNHSLSVH